MVHLELGRWVDETSGRMIRELSTFALPLDFLHGDYSQGVNTSHIMKTRGLENAISLSDLLVSQSHPDCLPPPMMTWNTAFAPLLTPP